MAWHKRDRNRWQVGSPSRQGTEEESLRAILRAKEALLEIAKSEKSLDEVLAALVDAVASALSVGLVEVLALSESGFTWRAGRGFNKQTTKGTYVDRDSHAGHAVATGSTEIIATYGLVTEYSVPPYLKDQRVESGMTTTIKARGTAWGVLAVHDKEYIRFAREEVNYIEEAAETAGAAISRHIDREKLRRALSKAERRLQLNVEARGAVGRAEGIQEAAQAAAWLSTKHISDWCWVALEMKGVPETVAIERTDERALADEFARALQQRSSADSNAMRGTLKVLRAGESDFIQDVAHELNARDPGDRDYLTALLRLGAQSCICVPIEVGRSRVGTICLITTTSQRRFELEDLAFCEDLAAVLALRVAGDLDPPHPEANVASRSPGRPLPTPSLTNRQRQVLRLIGEGRKLLQIAADLHIAYDSVRNHITALNKIFGTKQYEQLPEAARSRGVDLNDPRAY